MPHMLIIGGSDAGISAAWRMKEIDAQVGVTVVLADAYPGYSICGLPYFLSGEVTDWHTLAHHSVEELEKQGIRLLQTTGRRQFFRRKNWFTLFHP
jgi:NADPH-dependent 2,4-dienoyl-CoA reductase/sulfur reductase-like enzyme